MKIPLHSTITFLCISMSSFVLAHQEEDIDLSEVPAKVIQAAQEAKPGITLTESEIINDDGKTTYELEGYLNKEQFEILITEDGSLIEVKVDD